MTDVQTPAEGEDELRDELPAEVRAVMAANPEYSIAQAIDAAIAAQEADPDVGEAADQKVLQLLKQAKAAHEADDAQDDRAANRRVAKRKERRRSVPLGKEFRFHPLAEAGIEVREQSDTNELIVTGKPIKYGVPYSVRDSLGEFKETMHPGCVESILDRVDCRFLVNHDGIPMARVKPEGGERNTMRLWDTPDALCFEARLDARQQIANDFAIALERGDIDEMSVGMQVGRDKWSMDGTMEARDIYGLDNLLDVSGVTYAASPTTSIEIAKRMALEMPVESCARLRRYEVALRSGRMAPEDLADLLALLQGDEERVGKVLSKETQGKLVDVAKSIQSILSSAGYESDESESENDASEPVVDPGEQIRTDAGEKIRRLRAQTAMRKHRKG